MLKFNRYDYAAYLSFTAYACSSLVIPLVLVDMANDLKFPLEEGGMGMGGLLHICRAITMMATLLCSGMIAAKFGKRISLGVAMLLMGAGIIACSFAGIYAMVIPCVLLSGLGEGICEGLATPFVNDMHVDNPSAYVSIAHSFWSIGTIVCVLMTCALMGLGLSWRFVIATVGVLALVSALGFLWKESPTLIYPETPPAQSGDLWAKSVAIFKRGRFWVYCVCMMIGSGAEFGLTFWAASFIRLNFGGSVWTGALGTASLAFGMFLGRFYYGKLIPENRLWHLLLATSFGGVPVCLAMLLLTPTSFGGGIAALAVLFFLLFLAGLCVAPYWPSLQVYGVRRMPKQDSTMLYVYFSSVGIPGSGFFAWLMGAVGDHFGDLRMAFLVAPICMLGYGFALLIERFISKDDAKEIKADLKNA